MFIKTSYVWTTLFKKLLKLVAPEITKKNTLWDAISAEERLVVTLRFRATGRSSEDLKFGSATISTQALGHT